MQKAVSTPTKQTKTPKVRKRMKKIGLAMTEEMYHHLDVLKTEYYAATVPELCRIALTKFLDEQEKQKK